MQIMEDVREGCNVQPSSPGHAEQRTDNDSEIKSENHTENGYEEHNSNNENNEENHDNEKDEPKPSENDTEVRENIKTEFPEGNNLNEENYSNASSQSGESTKRKSDNEDFPTKRLRTDIHENFVSRDKILNEIIEMADCNNLEQIHMFSEQLLAEIKTLNELAKEKEREWNNIIHLKKIKEELLLRMQRKRQVMLISEKSDYVDESQNESNGDERSHQSILKSNLTKPALRKQRPTLDVQSIIADYRQRHPEAVPRRGRRIRHSQSDKLGNNVLNFSSMALGSGSQVRQNLQGVDMTSELGLLLNSMSGNRTDGSKPSNSDSAISLQDNTSFRDMLLQFAKLSQSERNELIQNAIKPPPPYPEVTVHPVPTTTAAPTNSLLHGILTKTPPKQNTKTSFSPTLARLLTAPERAAISHATSTPMITNNTTIHPSNMSISEILSTSKARNEITITPVGSQYESTPVKVRATDEEEAEDSADRLVIDEGGEAAEAKRAADNNSDTGDDIPLCQGCSQKPAQFVCAGCGNQWYCSRDCQVTVIVLIIYVVF
ncbi:hypothetical protein NQ317_015400 [Molorchus minor]|uniref:Uncharacterized protein n=1 Tax=Molorchus minor TaxID=1323400 RepID=A0ABQ9IS29_9CUCU|nr:hypothetical protein NQ317_015400 [Molorchus minor]